MLLNSYTLEFTRLSCGSEADDLRANLDEDISEVIPYLNGVLAGFQFTKEPRSVSIKLQGRLVVIHPMEICVRGPIGQSEGEEIIKRLREKINDTWERRGEIQPCFESAPKPKVLEILKLLPKTNCGECGYTTCMVFASHIVVGNQHLGDCPRLDDNGKARLSTYLEQFAT